MPFECWLTSRFFLAFLNISRPRYPDLDDLDIDIWNESCALKGFPFSWDSRRNHQLVRIALGFMDDNRDRCGATSIKMDGGINSQLSKWIVLVLWNIFYFSIYREESSQLTFIFFRGVGATTNQWIVLKVQWSSRDIFLIFYYIYSKSFLMMGLVSIGNHAHKKDDCL
jgi:hypothetical protein